MPEKNYSFSVLLLLLFLVAIGVRAVPLLYDGSFDPDSHFHARLSNDIARTQSIPVWDSLSLQGRIYSYPPLLHVLVGFFSRVSGFDSLLVLKIIGLLVGGLLGVSVFLLGRSLGQSDGIALWSGFFASVSSIAVWRTSGFTRPDGIALVLISFLLYLWLTRRNMLAFILSIALVLLHPLSAVIYALLLSVYFLLSFIQKYRVSFWVLFALGGMLLMFFWWVYSIGLPLSSYASDLSLSASELTRFWLLGFVVFFPLSWAFTTIGIVRGKIPIILGGWVILSVVIGSFGMRLATYMIPFLALLGGLGIHYLLSRFHMRKIFVPALAFFIIILGCFTFYSLMSGEGPYLNQSERNALSFLREYASPDDSVLTVWDQGHVVAYYTHLPVVIDGYFEFAHELKERDSVSWNVLYSSRCPVWSENMDRFNARFYYISKDEMATPVARLGLLSLDACPDMRLVYSADSVRIYERVVV
ncbi:MAG: hypothetical protein V1776_02380 [Candidatus Diapherotrites archaeon]